MHQRYIKSTLVLSLSHGNRWRRKRIKVDFANPDTLIHLATEFFSSKWMVLVQQQALCMAAVSLTIQLVGVVNNS